MQEIKTKKSKKRTVSMQITISADAYTNLLYACADKSLKPPTALRKILEVALRDDDIITAALKEDEE